MNQYPRLMLITARSAVLTASRAMSQPEFPAPTTRTRLSHASSALRQPIVCRTASLNSPGSSGMLECRCEPVCTTTCRWDG